MHDLNLAHEHCTGNKVEIENSTICGCFYCLKTFDKSQIENWLNEKDGTALCPFCSVDSVIGDKSGFPITKEFLEEMKAFWFKETEDKKGL